MVQNRIKQARTLRTTTIQAHDRRTADQARAGGSRWEPVGAVRIRGLVPVIYDRLMSRQPNAFSRGSLVAIGLVGVLALAACSSDEPSSTASTTTTSVAGQTASTTTTSAAVVAATTTTAAADSAATSTTATTGSTGGRVVQKPDDNVRNGDSGPGVEEIQRALKAAGYDIGVDGKFGPVTEKAVKDFQGKNGLTQDGVVGPVTWAKMQAGGQAAATSTTV